MPQIKNIILDLGGVLLNIDYTRTKKSFEELGVKNFEQMYSQANANQLFQNLEEGKISEENFYRELNECTGLQLYPSQIRQAWNAMLLDFREESLKHLPLLSAHHNLFLFSNTNHIHLQAFIKIYNKIERMHSFNEYFKKAFYSCEIGMRKPDIDSYKWVLKNAGADPACTLFVDDSYQNVAAAKIAGMQAILLENGLCIEQIL